MKVTIKLKPRETGRWRMLGSGSRGAEIRIDGKDVGAVSYSATKGGWYFYVQSEKFTLERHDSSASKTYEEAKKAALAYVKKHAKVSPRFRVAVPISGVLVTTYYAPNASEATERGREEAMRVLKRLTSRDVTWSDPGSPYASPLPGEEAGPVRMRIKDKAMT